MVCVLKKWYHIISYNKSKDMLVIYHISLQLVVILNWQFGESHNDRQIKCTPFMEPFILQTWVSFFTSCIYLLALPLKHITHTTLVIMHFSLDDIRNV